MIRCHARRSDEAVLAHRSARSVAAVLAILAVVACLGLAVPPATAADPSPLNGPARRTMANGDTAIFTTRNFSQDFIITVMVEGPEGDLEPIADGVHRLNDGTVFRTRGTVLQDPR